MPTALPTDDLVDLEPPARDEVEHIARGMASAPCGSGGLTELQRLVIEAMVRSMTGVHLEVGSLEPISAGDFAAGLAHRNEIFRTRVLQLMEVCHMILDEPSVEVADSVIEFARELSLDETCVTAARAVADGSRQLVAADFDRSTYLTGLDLSGFTPLRTGDDNVYAWTSTVVSDDLADKWRSLAALPTGTLGRGIHDFYLARGFRVPGEEGSAPPLLAQHDWVHVLADYGSRVESEIEVFAFIARASDDPAAFALLAMVLNLFQNGALPSAAGIFEAHTGNLHVEGMPSRLADALRRGAHCDGSIDFLAVDWFSLADQEVGDVRAHFGVTPKSEEAVADGSVGPWEAGGISPFQLDAGQARARDEGRAYQSFGAAL